MLIYFVFLMSVFKSFTTYTQESIHEGSHSMSKMNEGECDVVSRHVRRLLASGLAAADIAIISPYHAQVGCTWVFELCIDA